MVEFVYRTCVYYRDVDQMGIVYYSRYFEYFEAARTELLRSAGIEVPEIEARGYYLPVVSSHCDYIGSAKFNDLLEVKACIKQFKGARLRIDYEIRTGHAEVVTGYTEHCFTDHKQKPVRPPKFFITAISDV